MCLCLILTRHPGKLGTPLKGTEYFFLSSRNALYLLSDTSTPEVSNPTRNDSHRFLYSAAPDSIKLGLPGGPHFRTCCQWPVVLSAAVIQKICWAVTTVWEHRGSCFWYPSGMILEWYHCHFVDRFFLLCFLEGIIVIFSMCLLWAGLQLFHPRLQCFSLLREVVCSSFPQLFPQGNFLSANTFFSVFKSSSCFSLHNGNALTCGVFSFLKFGLPSHLF